VAKLKCYYTANYDGEHEAFVVARSQKVAARVAGVSLYAFRQLWVALDGGWPVYCAVVERLYTRQLGLLPLRRGGWVESRCETEDALKKAEV
jgi:hypothetical protein